MRRLIHKDESGAIIIEASILLPLFLFVFLTFYSVVKICFVEMKVQNALSNAAKEISSYSYIYAFTGAKAKMNSLSQTADSTKKDIKENVVDNISTFSDGVNKMLKTGENIGNDFEDFSGINDLLSNGEALKGYASDVKEHYNEIKTSGESLISYLKSNLGSSESRKTFFLSLIKVLANDGFTVIKNVLGEFLAKELSRPAFVTESEKRLFEQMDFSKTQLFPGDSSDIILVAEYSVQIAPYIPIDIKYTISQKVVTRGWLDGDGSSIERNGPQISASPVRTRNAVWDQSIEQRSQDIRKDKIAELKESGFFEVNGKQTAVYNPTTNTYAIIASSDPIYDTKDYDDELNHEEINDMLRRNISKVDDINSKIRYKEKNGNSTTIIDYYPYDHGEIKKIIYLTVPDDAGVEEAILEEWNKIEDQYKNNVELKIEKKYGGHYTQY